MVNANKTASVLTGRDAVTTCPFCSLLCEDIPPLASGRNPTCTLARHGYAGDERYRPRIGGREAGLDTVCAEAAKILASARAPLIGGLGTDVRGMRAALLLAERSGAIVDHAGGAGISDYTRVLCEEGWLGTTLSEIRNRADLVVCLGCDFDDRHPRFIERILGSSASRFLFIGERAPQKKWFTGGGKRRFLSSLHLDVPLSHLAEVAGTLAALAQGIALQRTRVSGYALKQWQAVADEMLSANYVVLCWQTVRLPTQDRETFMRSFARLARTVNEKTRCALFPLGGDDGATTAMQVCLWQSGYPLRISYQAGAIRHDPQEYDTLRLLAGGAVDALLWVSTLSGDPPPPTRIPCIFIGRADRPPPKADVFIPAATPGLHCNGVLFRGDGIVPLPVQARRPDDGLLSAESLLYRITCSFMAGAGG